MRFLTAGESHGEELTGIIEGLPSGLSVSAAFINDDLRRRRTAVGRGERMGLEHDEVRITSGLFDGVTTGAPMTLHIKNADNSGKRDFDFYRPGHVDYVGDFKYGYGDPALASERGSARETAMRTAIGSVCKQLLGELNVTIESRVLEIGGESGDDMLSAVEMAGRNGDTLGGKIWIGIKNLNAGIGSHVFWDRRLDYRLGGAFMSIPSVKAVEIGLGVDYANLSGKEVADEFETPQKRSSNNCGGIEGGISNGEDIEFTLTLKPVPSLVGLKTINSSGQPCLTEKIRSDVCVCQAACVVAESVAAIEIANAVIEVFGGDTMDELSARYYEKGKD